jgi:hypothetical protein
MFLRREYGPPANVRLKDQTFFIPFYTCFKLRVRTPANVRLRDQIFYTFLQMFLCREYGPQPACGWETKFFYTFLNMVLCREYGPPPACGWETKFFLYLFKHVVQTPSQPAAKRPDFLYLFTDVFMLRVRPPANLRLRDQIFFIPFYTCSTDPQPNCSWKTRLFLYLSIHVLSWEYGPQPTCGWESRFFLYI